MMIEDTLLLLRFKQGSTEALRGIYDKYKISLLKLAVTLTDEPNTAEDVVHDVFVRFAESADRIRLAGSLRAYLATSVINRVRNLRRDAARHGETSLDGAEQVCSSQRGPQQWAILSEQLAILSQALQGLPYEQREAVCLRTEMDMTFGQIAALQGVSADTAKGRYRYGIEKLRSHLMSEVPTCSPQTT